MKLVNVIDASTDWKKSISFSDDEFSILEIKQIKLIIANERTEKVYFVFKGIVLEDETTLRSLVESSVNVVALHAIFIPGEVDEQLEGVPLKIDSVSAEAASKWLAENPQHNAFKSVNKFTQSITVPPPPPAPPVPADPPVQWIQPGLMLRLLVTCFVFSYNKSLVFHKKVAMGCVAFCIYLLHIGAVKMWCKAIFRHVMREFFQLDHNNRIIDHTLGAPGQPAAHAAPGARDTPAVAVENYTWSRRIQQTIELCSSLSRQGVVIPTGPGWHKDILAVVIAIIGSFFPQWTPTGAPIVNWGV